MSDILTDAQRMFRDWISSEDGYDHCLRTVNAVFRGTVLSSGMAEVCPYPIRKNCSAEEKQDIREEIGHDFIAFLLDTFADELAKKPGLAHDILTGRIPHVLQYGWHRFINEWRETARSKKHNPRGYLYRRARETVSRDRRFTTRAPTGARVDYTMAPVRPDDGTVWTGPEDLYRDWPPSPMPASSSPEQEIFKTRFLTKCAVDFYARVSAHMQHDCWIPVRALTTFLTTHHPWLNAARETTLSADHAAPREAMENRIDRLARLDSISVLALQAASCLSPDEFFVFCLRLTRPEITFQEIASRMDFPDHNRAYRLYSRGTVKIKRFCENWPGPDPDDLPDEIGRAFLDAMQEECKKTKECP